MNQTVKRIVDILFQDVVENEETSALHEELMNNCQEHYQDLISRGLSEDEAVGEVVESLKGMKDVIAQYPKKAAAPAGAAEADEGKTWVFTGMDSLKVDTGDQDIFVGPSADGDIHVYCDDPEGLKTETAGSQLRIEGVKKIAKAASSAFDMKEGEEISRTGDPGGSAGWSDEGNRAGKPQRRYRMQLRDGQEDDSPDHQRGRVAAACDRKDRREPAGQQHERRGERTRLRTGCRGQQHERRRDGGRCV